MNMFCRKVLGKRRPARLLLFLTFILILPACTSDKSEQDVFSYAVSGEFRPFSYVNDRGELSGFDVEVGRLIGQQMGLKPKAVQYKFAGMIEGLKSGRFKAAVASQTITEDRARHVAFSQPYYFSGPQVFSRKETEELDLKGLEIAVSKGSTYLIQAKEFTNNIKIYDSDVTALEALSRGRHDAVITDFITGATAIKKGLKIHANQSMGQSEQGISVAKGNKELLAKVNSALDELRANGQLSSLSERYFERDITKKRKP